jgi:hypothetical protein
MNIGWFGTKKSARSEACALMANLIHVDCRMCKGNTYLDCNLCETAISSFNAVTKKIAADTLLRAAPQ